MTAQPTLADATVTLRPVRASDLPDVLAACQDPETQRWTTIPALRLACRWGFEQLRLARIEWRAYVGNDASRRVAEKAGFVLEGVQRARLAQRGERRDCWVAGLLPGDLG